MNSPLLFALYQLMHCVVLRREATLRRVRALRQAREAAAAALAIAAASSSRSTAQYDEADDVQTGVQANRGDHRAVRPHGYTGLDLAHS